LGEIFLGNIGFLERMEFTDIGDTVNTASRFSSLAKGRQILATWSSRERLRPEFEIQQLPSTKVKGKAEEVEVFGVFLSSLARYARVRRGRRERRIYFF